MAVGGGREVVEMRRGAPTVRTKMTVTLSGRHMLTACWVLLSLSLAADASRDACVCMHACASHRLHPNLPPCAADNRVYDGEVAGHFLAAFTRHMNAPFALM